MVKRQRTRKPDSLQGTLDLLVLQTLQREPRHGYAIAEHIQAVTGDALMVEEGTLYPALHRMEQCGWVTAKWEITPNKRRARIYRLTAAGQRQLAKSHEKWRDLIAAVSKVLKHA
jgi:transcriptional regulator